MDILDGCDDKERETFAKIALGESPENFPKDVIDRLVEKNLLNNHAGFLTISLYVLKKWENENKK